MSGLMKPGEGDLANTANYFASLIGGGINGTTDIPGIIQRGFTQPQYNGPLGAGINQSQSDMLGLSNNILQKYFGGGYSASPPNGMGPFTNTSSPTQGFDPNDPRRWMGFSQGLGSPFRTLIDPTTGQPAGGGTSNTGDANLPRWGFDPVTGRPVAQPRGLPTAMGNVGASDMSMMGRVASAFGDGSTLPGGGTGSANSAQAGYYDPSAPYPGMGPGSYIQGASAGPYRDPNFFASWLSQNPQFNAQFGSGAGNPIFSGQTTSGAPNLQDPNAGRSPSGGSILPDGSYSANSVPGYVPGQGGTNGPSTSGAQYGFGPSNPLNTGPTSYNFNPQFTGLDPFTKTPGLGIPQLGSGGVAGIPGSDQILGMFSKMMNGQPGSFDPQILKLLSGAGAGSLDKLATGNTGIQGILQNLAGTNATGAGAQPLGQAQDLVGQLMNNPALQTLLNPQGAGSGNLNTLFDALEKKRQTQLGTDTRDLREQFSANGLRFGTDLSGAISDRQSRSADDMMATIAQLLPTMSGQDIQAKTSGLGFLSQLPSLLTEIGKTSGTLGLGEKSASGDILSQILGSQGSAAAAGASSGNQGASTLANLFSNNQNSSLQALLSSPDALSKLNLLPYQTAGAGQSLAQGDLGLLAQPFNMNQTATTQSDTNAVRAYQEYQRTQSLFPQLLSFLSGTQTQQAPSPFTQGLSAINTGANAAGTAALLKSVK